MGTLQTLADAVAANQSAQVALAAGVGAIVLFALFMVKLLRDDRNRTGEDGRSPPRNKRERIAALEADVQRLRAALVVTDHERQFWRGTTLAVRDSAVEALEARGETRVAGLLRRLAPFEADAEDQPAAATTPEPAATVAPVVAEVIVEPAPPRLPKPDPAHGVRVKADGIIKTHVIGAMGAGLVPVPVVDLLAVAGLQIAMVQRLCTLYGVDFDRELARSSVVSLITGVLPVLAASGLASAAKSIPGLGSAAGAAGGSLTAGAVTWATGQVFMRHLERGGTLRSFSPRDARDAFAKALAEGRRAAASLGNRQATARS